MTDILHTDSSESYALTVATPLKDMLVVPMPLKPSRASPLGAVDGSSQEAETVLTWTTGYRTALSAMMSKHSFHFFCCSSPSAARA